jgi:serine protease Do
MRFRLIAVLGVVLAASVAVADPVSKSVPEPPAAAARPDRPASVEELKDIQSQVRAVTDRVIPVTVCLQVGSASGSGVIVSEDGLILTAGHVVAGEPGRPLTVVMPDGKKFKGKVLGFDPKIDSGMAQLTEKPEGGKWPYAEIAPSKELKGGQWVIATGHPGGYKQGRPPVVRVGRIGTPTFTQPDGVSFVQTDCTLVGGDSGGPLFDMKGRVIGIHSRIGEPINQNLDVPSDRYQDAWDGLTHGNVLGVKAYLGVSMTDDAGCKVEEVKPRGPAASAGFKVGDVIVRLAGHEVGSYDEVVNLLKDTKPYSQIVVEVQREVKRAESKDKKDDKDKQAVRQTEIIPLKVTVGYKSD